MDRTCPIVISYDGTVNNSNALNNNIQIGYYKRNTALAFNGNEPMVSRIKS